MLVIIVKLHTITLINYYIIHIISYILHSIEVSTVNKLYYYLILILNLLIHHTNTLYLLLYPTDIS